MMAIDQRSVFYHESIVDKQVDDLRDRMRLLQQDRRANIDLVEANKVSICCV
jgi:hypothetical protein